MVYKYKLVGRSKFAMSHCIGYQLIMIPAVIQK